MAVTFYELFLEFLRRNAMVAVVILAVLLARLLVTCSHHLYNRKSALRTFYYHES